MVAGQRGGLETRLRADTMAEFLSYAVGCMFGRYSLDAPGLILANQGDTLEDLSRQSPEPELRSDRRQCDPRARRRVVRRRHTERFRQFLRVTFGEAKFRENLAFIEEALGKNIRTYFTRDFFTDHVKRYKKRPIYWLFSSPRGTFNALIYMHRFRPDTLSVVLNDYLREFRSKLEGAPAARRRHSASTAAALGPAPKGRALRRSSDRKADRRDRRLGARRAVPARDPRIEIDLDNGVKANYPKLGAALKPIKGLNDAED